MRAIGSWPAPSADGATHEELVLKFDTAREKRVLVLPPLFDEASKLRRLLVEVMYRLNLSGIDSFLPDLPGCNESLIAHSEITLANLRQSVDSAIDHFRPDAFLAARSACLYAPATLPGWQYAAVPGRSVMRTLMRAQSIADKEAGKTTSMQEMEEIGRQDGFTLAGWPIGAQLFSSLMEAQPVENQNAAQIAQSDLGGTGLWLRAEPDEDPEQADALAAIIAIALVHA